MPIVKIDMGFPKDLRSAMSWRQAPSSNEQMAHCDWPIQRKYPFSPALTSAHFTSTVPHRADQRRRVKQCIELSYRHFPIDTTCTTEYSRESHSICKCLTESLMYALNFYGNDSYQGGRNDQQNCACYVALLSFGTVQKCTRTAHKSLSAPSRICGRSCDATRLCIIFS
jgi:hypothetical protein